MQPFEGDPNTRGRLTSLRNKPQQKQPGQLSASIPGRIVNQCVQLLFDGEGCVLLLCTWKAAFLKGRGYCHRLHLSVAGNRPLVAIDTDRRVGVLYKNSNIFETEV